MCKPLCGCVFGEDLGVERVGQIVCVELFKKLSLF